MLLHRNKIGMTAVLKNMETYVFFENVLVAFSADQQVELPLGVVRGHLDGFAGGFVVMPISGLALLAAVGGEKTPRREEIAVSTMLLISNQSWHCRRESGFISIKLTKS